ncbi:hypothetical protein AA11825_1007 [Acetobacter pomorum DSM 11825]|nr:hypothetical protein AA11825_1007 [Acetobacter pomorum DSM 11825]
MVLTKREMITRGRKKLPGACRAFYFLQGHNITMQAGGIAGKVGNIGRGTMGNIWGRLCVTGMYRI